ncbi:VOC family protein [Nocardioidaceae bacterium]|nr:VOC family protein [Nocardioidaceae bacterium]
MSPTLQVTFDAASPALLGRFWLHVLDPEGYAVDPPPNSEEAADASRDPEEVLARWHAFLAEQHVPREQWDSAYAIVDPTGTGPRLLFLRVPEAKTAKNRVHLDLRRGGDLRGQARMDALEAEAARLVAHGATRTARFEPAAFELGFIVMADPEGNEFCLT